MKTPFSLFLLIPLPFLSGCVHHTSVLGTYQTSCSRGVTENIQLWRDGTYQQEVRDRSGKTLAHRGTWRTRQNQDIEVLGWMNPRSIALGLPNAGTSRPDVILVAPLVSFAKPKVPINVGY
jgi:hypothetical protein